MKFWRGFLIGFRSALLVVLTLAALLAAAYFAL